MRLRAFKRRHAVMLVAGTALSLTLPTLTTALSAQTETTLIAATRSASLFWIAEARGYFEDEDVDVTLQLLNSGVKAAEAVVNGTVDLATSSEIAFVQAGFRDPTLKTLSTVAALNTCELIIRAQSGATDVAGLRGKRIGVSLGSASEFFLHRQLTLAELTVDDVEIVPLQPGEIVDAMGSGEIDATLTWHPYTDRARDAAGPDAIVLPAQSGDAYYFLLYGKERWLSTHLPESTAILRALIRAERWVADNPVEAKALVQEQLGYDTTTIESLWNSQFLTVALPQNLLWIMEEEAEWRISSGFEAPGTPVPNYLERIAPDALDAANPGAITYYR